MTHKQTLIDWALTFLVAFVVLGVMGSMDRAEQEQSARVLAEAKQQAVAKAKHEKTAKAHAYAELEAKSRYMTSFDEIAAK